MLLRGTRTAVFALVTTSAGALTIPTHAGAERAFDAPSAQSTSGQMPSPTRRPFAVSPSVKGVNEAATAVTHKAVAGQRGLFYPIRRFRLLDTRADQSAALAIKGRMAPGSELSLPLLSVGALPASGIRSVALTVTAVDAQGEGHLRV